ncbi:type II toxin-antitoxin system RelE/ParE family toxin [Candidatus Manganitrophus noduliformans]|uniref:Toxin n=1 Tax=Candidatus Manganitrophus noduliformans TaxID=2606439 RepID=A0A7X6DUJ6_9BACT|nr:type II toxin-antitoxin system RelE/ParE family toxin [Candidatus Manganitrophus noduliformans]NKE73677.1 type II toxin-antitoxin system RelE/ParE family toxin [Candidatus Manganitrophus noduliformans]
MPVIDKLPLALADLSEIWSYIAEDNAAKADDLLQLIEAKFNMLAEQPMMGRLRDELAPKLRSFPVGRYVIFYEVIPKGIVVVRVLHAAMDVGAHFEEE